MSLKLAAGKLLAANKAEGNNNTNDSVKYQKDVSQRTSRISNINSDLPFQYPAAESTKATTTESEENEAGKGTTHSSDDRLREDKSGPSGPLQCLMRKHIVDSLSIPRATKCRQHSQVKRHREVKV